MRPPRFRSSSLAPRLEARAVALGLDAPHSIAPGGEAVSPGHDGAWGQSPSEAASVTCWHGERRSDSHRPFLRPRPWRCLFIQAAPWGFPAGAAAGGLGGKKKRVRHPSSGRFAVSVAPWIALLGVLLTSILIFLSTVEWNGFPRKSPHVEGFPRM